MILKKSKVCGIKYKNCECCLEYSNVKDDLIIYKFLCWNKNYQKKLDANSKKETLTMISISLFYCWRKVSTHTYMDD